MDVRGARVLLTGATGGIGRELARALAACGGQVIVTGRRADRLEALAEQIGGTAVPADLGDRDALAPLVASAGEVDVFIANAAVAAFGFLHDYSIAEIDHALDVNLRAPMVLGRLIGERMAERGSGHLVFVSSLCGKAASGQASVYNATKFGLRGFAQALREDLRPFGVGVSAVFPGFVRDVGLVADAEVPLPRWIGTRSARDVARATLKAIRCDLGEIDVAPVWLRVAAALGAALPGPAIAAQRRVAPPITAALARHHGKSADRHGKSWRAGVAAADDLDHRDRAPRRRGRGRRLT
ncbi:SDR family NAD(P)-dependent oxidoreductase [Microtetraspora fusca]|uniref:SDR family NAD(P)-dependent oxidoreductase n=1 Tax=Microtetraspora fusca TaxID=1997 RepID=UPI000A057494|nr:SDR family NAD(P)-dependent oxidoreductase [Microtetraspora fusca]